MYYASHLLAPGSSTAIILWFYAFLVSEGQCCMKNDHDWSMYLCPLVHALTYPIVNKIV